MDPLDGRPSRTALMTAAARALHREEPPPRVLDDDFALRRITAELGEPMVSTFEPAEIERLWREPGVAELTHVGPEEAVAT